MGANAQTTVPTFTAGQVLTADQQNQSARTGVPVFAGTTERDAAFGGAGEKTLAEGQLCYLESTNVVQYYDGSSWATVGPSTAIAGTTATVATSQTTTSTSFTDLATVGPSVTVTTGTSVLVFVSAFLDNTNEQIQCDFDISGATTRSATATTALITRNNSGQARLGATRVNLVTVTAGSNTFTMKYSVNAGTGTFADRVITVVPL